MQMGIIDCKVTTGASEGKKNAGAVVAKCKQIKRKILQSVSGIIDGVARDENAPDETARLVGTWQEVEWVCPSRDIGKS